MSEGMRDLIQQAQAGDGRACEELFERFVQSVFAAAHRLAGNAADAEDITQETFIRAFRGIGGFQHRSGFQTWLYRILLNVAHDYSRKRAKGAPGSSVQLDEVESGLAARAEGGPAERAGAEEERRLLRRAVGGLPEQERVALTLVYLDGMTCREAAEIMGVKEGTVHWWLHEAPLNPMNLAETDVVVVEGGASLATVFPKHEKEQAEELVRFAGRGGTVLLLGLKAEVLPEYEGLLPKGTTLTETKVEQVLFERKEPLLWGIPPDALGRFSANWEAVAVSFPGNGRGHPPGIVGKVEVSGYNGGCGDSDPCP